VFVGLLEAVLKNAFEGAPVSGACACNCCDKTPTSGRRVSAFGYAQLVQCLLAWSIAQQRCLRRVSWRSPGYVLGGFVVRGHGWEELSTILSSLIEPAFEKVTCSPMKFTVNRPILVKDLPNFGKPVFESSSAAI